MKVWTIDVETVKDFKADIKVNGKQKNISLSWTEYPEDGEIKSQTYDISLGNVKATGTRLFHPSWIFGPVQYKAAIYVDGVKFDDVAVNDNSFSKDYTIGNGQTIKICGYYGNSTQAGNETCLMIDNPDIDESVLIPNFKILEDINKFIQDLKLKAENWNTIPTSTDTRNLIDKIASVTNRNNNIIGREISLKDLRDMRVQVTIYKDFKLFTGRYSDYTNWAVANGFTVIPNEDANLNAPVKSYTIDGTPYSPGTIYNGPVGSIKAETN